MLKNISMLLIFIFVGCSTPATFKIKDPYVSPVDGISGQLINSKSFKMKASKGWTNSGVDLNRGDEVTIEAEGLWSGLVNIPNFVGPEGQGYTVRGTREVSGISFAALIGRIGNGYPFYVGPELRFQATNNGPLLFCINKSEKYRELLKGYMSIKVDVHTKNKVNKNINLNQKISNGKSERKTLSKKWSVIVGISKYQNAGNNGLSNLMFADDDAKTFARSLRNMGWSEDHMKVLINDDATQRNIMIALESWLSKAGPDDQIILFWAGHGFPDPENPEKIYFACYDTDLSIPATGYRMDNVRRSLEEKKASNVVILADTCHAGKLITRSDGNRGISIVPNIRQNVPKGWVFMVGADTDRQAIEHSSWSNGAFTHSLVKGINGDADGFQSIGPKDGIVTMGELRAYMTTAMPEETQKVLGVAKHPVITTSTGDPDIWNLTLEVK